VTAAEAALAVKSHAANTVKCVMEQLEAAHVELDMCDKSVPDVKKCDI
jgi:hypothetical protein